MSDFILHVAASEAIIKANIDSITAEDGFNVIIVCCSSEQQARYWQKLAPVVHVGAARV